MNQPADDFAPLVLIAHAQAQLAPGLVHHELYTWEGLLSVFWHGDPSAEHVLITCGGAIGGVLGPAGALYHDLGNRFAHEHGMGVLRVGYRRSNHIDSCTQDLLAVAELAAEGGARRFVTMGHSFGGAPALRAAVLLGDAAAGAVTLSTQTAGCEDSEALAERNCRVIHLHGDADDVLPAMASQMVQMLTEGELVILRGASHGLVEAHDELRERLGAWIPACFD